MIIPQCKKYRSSGRISWIQWSKTSSKTNSRWKICTNWFHLTNAKALKKKQIWWSMPMKSWYPRPSKVDHSSQIKHFPTPLPFIQAVSTWVFIRKTSYHESLLFNFYYTRHIEHLIRHLTDHSWSKILNYELNFFQNYSNIEEHLWQWHKNDSDLYISTDR